MSLSQAEVEALLPQFEGVVKHTSRLIVEDGVEIEFEDVCQILRVRVWQAVQKFSDERTATMTGVKRGRTPLERFVFGCLVNLRYDLQNRHVRRYNSSIDQIREHVAGDGHTESVAEWFDAKFLSVSADEVYAEVIEPDEPDLPPDLTEIERQVVLLKYEGLLASDIERELGLSRAQRQRVLESAREKLARRIAAQRGRAPLLPLTGAAQPERPAQLSRVA